MTDWFTDTTAAATFSIVETLTILDYQACPVFSFTEIQVLIAGAQTFDASPDPVVTVDGQQYITVTHNYPELRLNMLPSLGPLFEVVCDIYWILLSSRAKHGMVSHLFTVEQ
jgi:hypothetical protein